MNLLVSEGRSPALLALEDGTTFAGWSAGAAGETFGEVVFNTSMTGYQEILSDPSYAGQIVTLTYPQVGNYGICEDDFQAPRLHLCGLVVRDMCHTPSNWRSVASLPELLRSREVVAIEGVDTRALTLRIRGGGAMRAAISTTDLDPKSLVARVRREQASRCMYCGVAFCQSGMSFGQSRPTGCPLHNLIPEWNDLLYRGLWQQASARLALTNPFPKFTGRVCPAPCELACNLGLNDQPTTIRDNERAISDWSWGANAVAPLTPAPKDAPSVTVVGAGPAGMSCAWELTRLGARVTLVERSDRAGGLLMYGIPHMKLPKDVVQRRIDLLRESGVELRLCTDASEPDVAAALLEGSDAVVVAVGARDARCPGVPGADLPGIVLAIDYLTSATRHLLDGGEPRIDAKGLGRGRDYSGRFDFVVYEVQPDRSEVPVLAIELDGMEHVSDEAVRARDRKKEAICARHGFQLIRVENSYARRYHFMKDILVAYFKGK